jgi:hypothetical protein
LGLVVHGLQNVRNREACAPSQDVEATTTTAMRRMNAIATPISRVRFQRPEVENAAGGSAA